MNLNRRKFLSGMAGASSLAAIETLGMNLLSIHQAQAATDLDVNYDTPDYKALVAVYLAGGNDNGNTLIPIDDYNYANYQAHRQTIALDRAQLTALQPKNPLDKPVTYALNPKLTKMTELFKSGDLAVLQNVGTLVAPMTKAQFGKSPQITPYGLFSHVDQQRLWQTCSENNLVQSGWGSMLGRMSSTKNSNPLFACISPSGGAMPLLAGNGVNQFVITENGSNVSIGTGNASKNLFGNSNVGTSIIDMMQSTGNNLLENELARTFDRSLVSQSMLIDAFKASADIATLFDTNSFSRQLLAVAKAIIANQKLGLKRQVFLVVLGGFDTHSDLVSRHNTLMTTLDNGLSSFYQALSQANLKNNVTTFTMSEFGRTLGSNGSGSDHGWGAHHLILGGSIRGGNIYGLTPDFAMNSNDDVGRGRYIPTTSVAQYTATLARWFGIENNRIPEAIPYINNFPERYLKFI